jgi:hypothetical protein
MRREGVLGLVIDPPLAPPFSRGGNAAWGGHQKTPFVLCVPFVFFVLKNPRSPLQTVAFGA